MYKVQNKHVVSNNVQKHNFFYKDRMNNTLKEENFVEETFASGKIRKIFGINFRELAVFAFLARINFPEFMI